MILPHVGLIILSSLYVVTGAAVFYNLERPHEEQTRHEKLDKIFQLKNTLLDNFWLLSSPSSSSGQEELITVDNFLAPEKLLQQDMDNLTHNLFVAFDTHYIDTTHLLRVEDRSQLVKAGINEVNVSTTVSKDVYRREGTNVWTFNAAIFFSSTLLTTIGKCEIWVLEEQFLKINHFIKIVCLFVYFLQDFDPLIYDFNF